MPIPDLATNNKNEVLLRTRRNSVAFIFDKFIGITGWIFGLESFFDSESSGCSKIHGFIGGKWADIKYDLNYIERKIRESRRDLKNTAIKHFKIENKAIRRKYFKKSYKGYYLTSASRSYTGSYVLDSGLNANNRRKVYYNENFKKLVEKMNANKDKYLCDTPYRKAEIHKYPGFEKDVKQMMRELGSLVEFTRSNFYV